MEQEPGRRSKAARILERFRAGSISAELAVAELALSEESTEALVRAASAEPALAELVRAHAAELPRLVELAHAFDHHPDAVEADPVEAVRRFFDRAVEQDEAASVALCSLGDAKILERATAELIGVLDGRGLIDPGARVLDLGCGIGRVTAALAPRVRSIAGVDVSEGMIARARRRCAGLENVALFLGNACALDALEDASFELVLAADSFPYLCRAGPRHVAGAFGEAARVLSRGGRLLIFNFAYGSDPEARAGEVARHAAASGFAPVELGARPCALWDAELHDLRRV